MPGKLAPDAFCCCASDDVTVVLDTCRDPDDLRPLEPVNSKKKTNVKIE